MVSDDTPAPFYPDCYFAEYDAQTYGEAERGRRKRRCRKRK